MTKIISFMLSLLLFFSTGIIDGKKEIQNFFDRTGVNYCFTGRLIADIIRNSQLKSKQYPDSGSYKKKVLIDDTGDDFVTLPEMNIKTQQWIANEITLESDIRYSNPFNDVDVDLILAGNGVKYIIPGFWNGGKTWKIRFACPEEGEWLFKTVCTDKSNKKLDGRTGRVICKKYTGEYEIYNHGFVTTSYGKKYMTYDDGTPFFYLGDTHWSLGDETVDMVKTICTKRSQQGFTVMQSEPIGATFDFTNGIDESDIPGLNDYDEKFKIIAENGLVHANAEFFFPAYMSVLIDNNGGYSSEKITVKNGRKEETVNDISDSAKKYLEKITRYWVARYSAYPVMWTLGQEVDRDFYYNRGEHNGWNYINNPYKLVAEYIYKYDGYSHPLSAHQENSGGTVAYGNGKTVNESLKSYCSSYPSSFRDVEAHNWYAAQWSPDFTGQSSQEKEKDYWYNSQGKPVINYEGRYCYLWTKNFGSRMQGWASYLSGMFGYGWGAHDTWSYLNIYGEDEDSYDGIDTITSEEKINATWRDSLEYPSSYQMGYMKKFFTSFDWWNLIPRFNNRFYFSRSPGVFEYTASNQDNSEMVIYFYSFSDNSVGENPNGNEYTGCMTGKIGGLEPGTKYKYRWFNPVTGEFSEEEEFISTPFGTYSIGQRKWNGEIACCDMVFYMYK